MTRTISALPTIADAVAAGRPDMVVQHDGVHDYQTCAVCHRSWGTDSNDYDDCPDADYDAPGVRDGTICPDSTCPGLMGIFARAHIAWREGDA